MRVKKWVRNQQDQSKTTTISMASLNSTDLKIRRIIRSILWMIKAGLLLFAWGGQLMRKMYLQRFSITLGIILGVVVLCWGGDNFDDSAFINYEEYFPFGETSFGSFGKKRYRFSGKERDEESGLTYYGARYYVQWIGRWSSPDPLYSNLSKELVKVLRGSCGGSLYKAFNCSPIDQMIKNGMATVSEQKAIVLGLQAEYTRIMAEVSANPPSNLSNGHSKLRRARLGK